MGKLIVTEFVTVDGVAQAPGRPDEDASGDFRYGGWQAPYVHHGGDLRRIARQQLARGGLGQLCRGLGRVEDDRAGRRARRRRPRARPARRADEKTIAGTGACYAGADSLCIDELGVHGCVLVSRPVSR